MVAKIRLTSPRGIMPMPTSSRSPGAPLMPAEAASFPATATTSIAPASPSTAGLANWPTCASIPICRKNTGMKRWPTGVSSRRMRSAAGLRVSERPATKAPMIGASLAALASSDTPKVNARARATSVPLDRL